MRSVLRLVLTIAVASLAGCGRPSPVQPDRTPGAASVTQPGDATAAKPEIDPTYANGTVVYMIGPHIIPGARETMPNAYAHAEELYLVTYRQQTLPAPGAGPITLPSGYQPQCNPCFHPGLPFQFVYHDHVITGAPGMGTNGTAGEYKGPWKIIVLVYDPAYANSPGFMPIKSATDIDKAEAGGGVFLPINPAPGGNPYEIDTGNLLICPTVSPHA
jgi:predicted small lipoprotein YifL